MLVNVESFLLNALVNSQTSNLLHTEEYHDTHYQCPCIDTKDAEGLCSKESPAMTIEKSSVYSKHTSHQCTQDTTYSMNGTCTYRVVNMELAVYELY